MEMGFVPIKGERYLQDLTTNYQDILSGVQSELDQFKAGGSRLRWIYAFTHMDENKLYRSNVEDFISVLKSYPYKVSSLRECLNESPFLDAVKQPEFGQKTNAGSMVSMASIAVMLLMLM